MRNASNRKPRIRKRANRRQYGIFRVARKGYEWQRVSVHLPLFREFIVWERK